MATLKCQTSVFAGGDNVGANSGNIRILLATPTGDHSLQRISESHSTGIVKLN